MMTICRTEVTGLVAEDSDGINAEGTWEKVQVEMEAALIDMLQVGNDTVSNGITTASAQSIIRLLI